MTRPQGERDARLDGDTSLGRLEAFSDGVIAIIVTIMVLELKPPHGGAFKDLVALWPTALSYALSFLIVAIYWVNHRHVLRYATRVTPLFLWLNLLLLFVISLIPFSTAWVGEHLGETAPNAVYAANQLFGGISFLLMQEVVNRQNRHRADLIATIGKARLIGTVSMAIYASGVFASFFLPGAALIAAGLVAALYFTPVSAPAPPARG